MSAGQLAAIFAREQQAFVSARPQSRALAQRSSAHFPHGVPMHWMRDWGTAFPLFVHEAQGAELVDADLIVVGNVRMQGLGRVLGSVGNDVAHSAPCSVLIVKTV